jgi:class 3 adenylate cyclase
MMQPAEPDRSMIRLSIRRKILGIATGLIVLMAIASVLSMVMVSRVSGQLQQLTESYIPAYGHLARMNIRSLERALALRRMVIAKMQSPPDEQGFAERRSLYEAKNAEVDQEAEGALASVNALIEAGNSIADTAALARIQSRIDSANKDLRRYLNDEQERLLPLLDARDFPKISKSLARTDALRDEFNQKIDAIRADMLSLVVSHASTTMQDEHRILLISTVLTALAALLGWTFSALVGTGISRPVRRLLEGTRAVEAGHLDESITITTRDEVGQLTAAFNRMVEQLRHKEQIRDTFGRYLDPRVVERLIDRPSTIATEGERRVMTVLFCDMEGFTRVSEGMTPPGLVRVMNRYLSVMSEPIRKQQGVIDKYIGDAIMAYWGPPFNEDADQARLACSAAIDMIERVGTLRTELSELVGVRNISISSDIRIGIATGEAIVGSIGSELMMSYTVMGDTVNLASRLEAANKVYGGRCLVTEATISAAGGAIEAREIDRVVVAGQTRPQAVFEIMGRKGELTQQQQTLRTQYSQGLAAYRTRRWEEALGALNSALEAVPGDGPSTTLAERVKGLHANPPADDWDGTRRLDYK